MGVGVGVGGGVGVGSGVGVGVTVGVAVGSCVFVSVSPGADAEPVPGSSHATAEKAATKSSPARASQGNLGVSR